MRSRTRAMAQNPRRPLTWRGRAPRASVRLDGCVGLRIFFWVEGCREPEGTKIDLTISRG